MVRHLKNNLPGMKYLLHLNQREGRAGGCGRRSDDIKALKANLDFHRVRQLQGFFFGL